MSDELKPCPFCGGKGDLREAGRINGAIVSCTECGACVNSAWPKGCEGAAINQWNTRTHEPIDVERAKFVAHGEWRKPPEDEVVEFGALWGAGGSGTTYTPNTEALKAWKFIGNTYSIGGASEAVYRQYEIVGKALGGSDDNCPARTHEPVDVGGFVSVPIDAGERLGEAFLQTLFGSEFETPYVDRLNSVIQTANKAFPNHTPQANTEALEAFDSGAVCGNEYYWSDKDDIKTIRKSLGG